jgi:pimeloyl-ACP methyl ester carboxylesterase
MGIIARNTGGRRYAGRRYAGGRRRVCAAAGLAALVLASMVLPAAPGTAGAAAMGRIPLHECRLAHPLRLASIIARCGEFAVALDRNEPGGVEITLALAVIPALNRSARAAPLFILAGGPGQSAIDLYVSFAAAFARVARNHDIVLLDQRGTGRSSPLRCDYPDDWRQSDAALAAIRRATLECAAKYGDRVRFYTTGAAVADLDEVRRALGFGAIDLYAASYGTRVAELYMRHHPAAVHAVVLDGVTYPGQAVGMDTPLDGERALDRIVRRCRDSPDCAGAYPALQAELTGLERMYGPARRSIIVADPLTGLPQTVEFNHVLLAAALRFLSYSASQAALLPMLIHQAALGNLAPLAAQPIMISGQLGDQIASGMQNTVICSEDAPLFGEPEALRARLAGTYQGTDQIDAFRTICASWPKGPVDADLHAPLESGIPTLLLSGEADPVTPPADAERVLAGLGAARHLVLAGEGHGQLATGCVPRLIAAFLDHPDPAALDAGCLGRHRPPPFFVDPTGPAP